MTRQLPEDPIIRQLVAQARRSQLSRRAVLAGAGAGATALALAACTPSGTEAPTAATDNSANDPTLNWANWPAYLDEDDDGIAPLPSTPTMKKPDRSKRRYSVALKRDAELEDFLQEIEQEEDLEQTEGDTGSVRVSVPPGLSAGEVLYVGTPDGREIVVEVPAGCGAGDDIVVDVGEVRALVCEMGGLAEKAIGDAMDRGMVLVMS